MRRWFVVAFPFARRRETAPVNRAARVSMIEKLHLRFVQCLALGLVCALAWLGWGILANLRRHSFGREFLNAESVRAEVAGALQRCKQAEGHFAGIDGLGPEGCGKLEWLQVGQSRRGLQIELQSTVDTYLMVLWPIGRDKRQLGYAADESGRLRILIRE